MRRPIQVLAAAAAPAGSWARERSRKKRRGPARELVSEIDLGYTFLGCKEARRLGRPGVGAGMFLELWAASANSDA